MEINSYLLIRIRSNMIDTKKYKSFCHKECEFFPCHDHIPEGDFNCMFCFCPLYVLGEKCKGNFKILENGWKDCSACSYPHRKENYDKVIETLTGYYESTMMKK